MIDLPVFCCIPYYGKVYLPDKDYEELAAQLRLTLNNKEEFEKIVKKILKELKKK